MIQQWSYYDKIWLDDMGAEAENATCFFPMFRHTHIAIEIVEEIYRNNVW